MNYSKVWQKIIYDTLLASLHDQNKSGFFRGVGFFLANQSFLKTF